MLFDFKNVQLTGEVYAELIAKWLPGELKQIKEWRANYEENAKKPKPRHVLPRWVRSLVGIYDYGEYYGSLEKDQMLRDREREFLEYRRRMDFALKNPTAIFTFEVYALDAIDAMPWPEKPKNID